MSWSCANGAISGWKPSCRTTSTLRARAFLEKNSSHEPTEILYEDWFLDGVIKNPQAAGAVRSLLGVNFGLPLLMSNHRVEYPTEAQGWHRDGNSKFTHELRNLQVFYLPQDCTMEMGADRDYPRDASSLLRQ